MRDERKDITTNQFHHASIDNTFSRLAVSAEQLNLKTSIGGRSRNWNVNSAEVSSEIGATQSARALRAFVTTQIGR